MRQLFTAADVRHLVQIQKSATLVLGPADLITPEAVDVARELGLRLIREELRASSQPAPLPPLRVVSGAGVSLEAFGASRVPPGMSVGLKDVITSGDGSPMAAGYMTLDASPGGSGEFPWTLSYDEIDIVLAGELVITRGGEQIRGGPGDVLFIPKGSAITFGTPSHCRFVYVTFPADWSQ